MTLKMVGEVGHHNMRIIGKPHHNYVKTLHDAWIPEFGSGSGMDPDPARFRVLDPVRIRPDLKIVDPVHP